MRFKAEQVDALARGAREKFIGRLAAHVRARYPEAVWDVSPADLRGRLEALVDRAQGYGLRTQKEAAYFTELAFLLGDAFDRDPAFPWAGAILCDASLPGAAKVAALARRLRPF